MPPTLEAADSFAGFDSGGSATGLAAGAAIGGGAMATTGAAAGCATVTGCCGFDVAAEIGVATGSIDAGAGWFGTSSNMPALFDADGTGTAVAGLEAGFGVCAITSCEAVTAVACASTDALCMPGGLNRISSPTRILYCGAAMPFHCATSR